MTLAMFDSVNVASRSPYNSYINFSGLPSNINVKKVNLVAAAAKSAQVILNGLIPASTSAAVRTQLEYGHLAQLNIHIGSLDRDSSRTINGLALGEWVGQQVLLKRSTDGHTPNHCNSFPNAATPACPNYVINSTVWSEYQYNLPYFPGAPNSWIPSSCSFQHSLLQ
jgi:hypothetical protein